MIVLSVCVGIPDWKFKAWRRLCWINLPLFCNLFELSSIEYRI